MFGDHGAQREIYTKLQFKTFIVALLYIINLQMHFISVGTFEKLSYSPLQTDNEVDQCKRIQQNEARLSEIN